MIPVLLLLLLLLPAAHGQEQLLLKGQFGKIDTTSDASAQDGAKQILKSLAGMSGSETFVPLSLYQAKDSDAKHMRFGQVVHGLAVEGAAIVVHTDEKGEVIGINGELVDESTVPLKPTIKAKTAIKAALYESRVPKNEHRNCSPPELTVVRGLEDGEAHLAWTCTVRYDTMGSDGWAKPFKDKIFAAASGRPGLIQIHPLIHGQDAGVPNIDTQDCMETVADVCETVSTDPNEITLPSDYAVQCAHNFTIATYDYYWNMFGRDGIDDDGMTMISRVHFGVAYNNAFWDGQKMTYGDGDGVTFVPLSQDADVVAHELTHGVTERTSNLIYYGESGALNEAISDIVGAMVEQGLGASVEDIWKLGEDVYTPDIPGDALRYMYDPVLDGWSYDYWPDRYQGEDDSGGVHWNSGIANLATYLMVMGGVHPRGHTNIEVTPIGGIPDTQLAYDIASSIWYGSNVGCLTPSSDFAMARYCTADIYGELLGYAENVHQAWDAVGVPNEPPGDPPTYHPTYLPTELPTEQPTLQPTLLPTESPTFDDDNFPDFPTTMSPTYDDDYNPTMSPTYAHTATPVPTVAQSKRPTMVTSKSGKQSKSSGSKSSKMSKKNNLCEGDMCDKKRTRKHKADDPNLQVFSMR